MKRIYLDNNATTKLCPEAIKAIKRHMDHFVANASSTHADGRAAKKILTDARVSISNFLNVHPCEILFTSGGTEGLNLLIRGLKPKEGHTLTSPLEHKAILKTVENARFTRPNDIEKAITSDTKLLIFSSVNGETGEKLNLPHVAALAKSHGISLIIDAVAQLGKEPIVIPEGVSAMVFSAHKCHGPKGVGFCYVKRGLKFPALFPGTQELERRGGTENLLGIVGMAAAIKVLEKEQSAITEKLRLLRDHFEKALPSSAQINGRDPRAPNVSNVAFPGHLGEDLLIELDKAGISVSHGSACSAGAMEPSHVLTQMGYAPERVRSSLRFSFSRFNTIDEINHVIEILKSI